METFFVCTLIRRLIFLVVFFMTTPAIAKCWYESGMGVFHSKGLENRIPTGEVSGEHRGLEGSADLHTDTHAVSGFASASCFLYDPWYVRGGYLSQLEASLSGSAHLQYEKTSLEVDGFVSASISGPTLSVGREFVHKNVFFGAELGILKGQGIVRVSGNASVRSDYFSGKYSTSFQGEKKGYVPILRLTLGYKMTDRLGVSVVFDQYARDYRATYLVLRVTK